MYISECGKVWHLLGMKRSSNEREERMKKRFNLGVAREQAEKAETARKTANDKRLAKLQQRSRRIEVRKKNVPLMSTARDNRETDAEMLSIYDNMHVAATNYFGNVQNVVTPHNRSYALDWLVQVQMHFKLSNKSLFLAVNIFDRLLAVQQINHASVQLTCISSLMIAVKYEQVWPLSVSDYTFICGNAYTPRQICDMERTILGRIDYRLTVPTLSSFLSILCKKYYGNETLVWLASYLCELTLLEYSFYKHKPLLVCAACIMVARMSLGYKAWTKTLAKHSKCKEGQLRMIASEVILMHRAAPTSGFQSVREKYSKKGLGNVSAIKALPLRNTL